MSYTKTAKQKTFLSFSRKFGDEGSVVQKVIFLTSLNLVTGRTIKNCMYFCRIPQLIQKKINR